MDADGRLAITERLPQLWPVVEAPYRDGQSRWPWAVSDCPSFSFVRLGGAITAGDIGLVIAQLVAYNRIEGHDVGTLQAGIIEAESLILPGGLQTSLGDQEINPSCCCGLECWREWERVLDGGAGPWLGHDPAPWVEVSGNVVRVWSDGAMNHASDVFSIVFERSRFRAELDRAGKELRAFLERSAAWTRSAGFSDADAVCRKLDACFAISKPRRIAAPTAG